MVCMHVGMCVCVFTPVSCKVHFMSWGQSPSLAKISLRSRLCFIPRTHTLDRDLGSSFLEDCSCLVLNFSCKDTAPRVLVYPRTSLPCPYIQEDWCAQPACTELKLEVLAGLACPTAVLSSSPCPPGALPALWLSLVNQAGLETNSLWLSTDAGGGT